jgi:threonine synthase
LRYVSTEGSAPPVSLEEALFSGPAPDGGLYVPESLPPVEAPAPETPLGDTALAVANALFGADVPAGDLETIVSRSLDFEIPLAPVTGPVFSLELFHGPTLAFKDVGARFMARLMLHFLERRNREATVLVATSGDTGSAVAHAFHRLPGIRVVVLFPRGKVSPLQQRLFTTLGENVSSLAVEGTFDDCQRLVKQAFHDAELRARGGLVSANSINVGRLLPQTFYYFHLLAQLHEGANGPLIVSVPSGNFGNLTAGLFAKRMGLSCRRFIAATNANDVVPQYLASGRFRPRASIETLSSAMDVGNPSNFARILWLYRRSLEDIRRDVAGSAHGDEETIDAIREVHRRTGYLLEPHSAVGYLGALEAARTAGPGAVSVFLSTAHPAKFRDTVEGAIATEIGLPRALAAVAERPEHIVSIPAEYGALQEYLIS